MYNAKNNYQVILVALMSLASTLCALSQRLSDYRILINKATDEDSTISMFDNDSCFFRLADSRGMVMKSNLYDVEWQVWLEHLSGKKVGIGFGHDPAAGKLKITPQFFGLGVPAGLQDNLVVWCDDSIADIPYVKGTVICALKEKNSKYTAYTYSFPHTLKIKVLPFVPQLKIKDCSQSDVWEEPPYGTYIGYAVTLAVEAKNFDEGLFYYVDEAYPVPFAFSPFNKDSMTPFYGKWEPICPPGFFFCITGNDYGNTTSSILPFTEIGLIPMSVENERISSTQYQINGNNLNFSNELPIRNVTIYNIQGKRFFSKNDVTDESIHLDKGVYLLQITTDKTTTSKFIIK